MLLLHTHITFVIVSSYASIARSLCTYSRNTCGVTSYPLKLLLKYGFLYAGATRPQYAPEPLDVGKQLKVTIALPDGSREALGTSGPIDAGKRSLVNDSTS
jgi:hypothetical protein